MERLFDTGHPDLNSTLTPMGVSPRETEVVDLILKGFSNKELTKRFLISVDTANKHTFNVNRKSGVQNWLQPSHFVQNRAESSGRDGS